MIYTNLDPAVTDSGKSCGIVEVPVGDPITPRTDKGCSQIRQADWIAGEDLNAGNKRVLDEKWTNEVCRPGNSTYTVLNANCNGGICQCNEHYYASERDGKSLNCAHHKFK